MATTLIFGTKLSLASGPLTENTAAKVVVCTKEQLGSLKDLAGLEFLPKDITAPFSNELAESNVTFYTEEKKAVTVAVYSNERTRYNAVVRADNIADVVGKNVLKNQDTHVVVILSDVSHAQAAAFAISRCFPLYSRKTSSTMKARTVFVDFLVPGKTTTEISKAIEYATLNTVATSIRLCQRLVDTPTNELNVDTYVKEVETIARGLPNVSLTVIRGTELRDKGFGGLWNVGKASTDMPALCVLSYKPSGGDENLAMAWIGKGITYDTGGLSIKGKEYMPGMKVDMGGSAACLAAFQATVLSGYKHPLHTVLCIAENSVSKESQRPDDVWTAYSGKSIEINNTDAEGRLVLADGIAYTTKHLNPRVIVDMATLTGAQSYATGQKHSGVLSNSAKLESLMVSAGKHSGDLTFPLIYCPEYLGIGAQFASQVADMKNSVKDRSNAPSSGAGHFIEEHICGEGWKASGDDEPSKLWAHVDMAAPCTTKDGRATAYGVALLWQLAQNVQQGKL